MCTPLALSPYESHAKSEPLRSSSPPLLPLLFLLLLPTPHTHRDQDFTNHTVQEEAPYDLAGGAGAFLFLCSVWGVCGVRGCGVPLRACCALCNRRGEPLSGCVALQARSGAQAVRKCEWPRDSTGGNPGTHDLEIFQHDGGLRVPDGRHSHG